MQEDAIQNAHATLARSLQTMNFAAHPNGEPYLTQHALWMHLSL